MITLDSKINLLECYLKNEKINDKLLIKLGLSKEDITELTQKDKLSPIKSKSLISKDEYTLNENTITEIIKELFDNKRNDLALAYLKILYNKGIKNKYIILRLILNEITNKNYKINELINDLKLIDQKSANFLLLLINYFTILSEEDVLKIKSLTYNDIKIKNEGNKEKARINNYIRSLCLNQKYSYAFSIFLKYTEKVHDNEIESRIIRHLLFHIIKIEEDFTNKILKLIREKNYSEIINLYESESRKRKLRKDEQEIIDLCYEINDINETNIVYDEISLNKLDTCKDNKIKSSLEKDFYELNMQIYSYKKMISLLLNNNLLDEFLEENNLTKYSNLTHLLLSISKYKNEDDYKSIMPTLISIIRNKYAFNYKYFISECLNTINEKLKNTYISLIKEALEIEQNEDLKILVTNYLSENQIDLPIEPKEQNKILSLNMLI